MALTDSITRFAVGRGGSPSLSLYNATVAPALMLLRAQALEMLGKREDALVLARGMSAIIAPDTPRAKALRGAYSDVAQWLAATTDVKPGIAVPGKR